VNWTEEGSKDRVEGDCILKEKGIAGSERCTGDILGEFLIGTNSGEDAGEDDGELVAVSQGNGLVVGVADRK